MVGKWLKKHANMLDISKNATTKCHDNHIILWFYGTAERLAYLEMGAVTHGYITDLNK